MRRLLLAVLCAVVLPAAAQAATVTYDATVAIDVDYEWRALWQESPAPDFRRHDYYHHTTTRVTTFLPGITFTDGVLQPYALRPETVDATTGTFNRLDTTRNGSAEYACVFDGADTEFGQASITPAGGAAFKLSVVDELVANAACTYPPDIHSHGQLLRLDDLLAKDLFAARVDPGPALGYGEIVEPIYGGRLNADCPGWDSDTSACTFRWEGTVKLVKRGSGGTPDPVDVIPSPTPIPTPGPDVVDNTIKLIETWLHDRQVADEIEASFVNHGRKARVEFDCPGPCSSVVKAYFRGTRASFGSASFAPVGAQLQAAVERRRVRATLPISAQQRKRIRRRGGATFRLEATFPGYTPQRAAVTVRVP